VNIVNATGEGQAAVRSLFARISRQLFDPKVTFYNFENAIIDVSEVLDSQFTSYSAKNLNETDAFLLSQIIKKLGSEAMPLLDDEVKRVLHPGKPLDLLEFLVDPKGVGPGASGKKATETVAEPTTSVDATPISKAEPKKKKK
jgi:hypothetical protein